MNDEMKRALSIPKNPITGIVLKKAAVLVAEMIELEERIRSMDIHSSMDFEKGKHFEDKVDMILTDIHMSMYEAMRVVDDCEAPGDGPPKWNESGFLRERFDIDPRTFPPNPAQTEE